MMAGVTGIFDYNLEVVLVETGHVLKVYYKVSSIEFILQRNLTFPLIQNLQQSDFNNITVRPFTDHEPPYVTVSWQSLDVPPLKIQFGSEIMLEISVSNGKLAANRIFHHCN